MVLLSKGYLSISHRRMFDSGQGKAVKRRVAMQMAQCRAFVESTDRETSHATRQRQLVKADCVPTFIRPSFPVVPVEINK